MKKSNTIIFAAFIGVLSAVLVVLFLHKDRLKNCPFCGRFFYDDDALDAYEEDIFEDIDENPGASAKEEKPSAASKIRRGYTSIRFHKQ